MQNVSEIKKPFNRLKQEMMPAEDSSSDIIRDASFYTACAYIYQLTIFAVGMVNKRFLGPENAGIWALFLMVMSYVSLHPLGLIDGTERQIAFYRGMGKQDYARRIKDNMFGTVGLSSVIFGTMIVGFTIFAGGYLGQNLRWALYHVGFALPVFMTLSIVTVSLRATKKFRLLGLTLIGVALTNASLGVFLVYNWKLDGMFTAYILVNGLNVGFWFIYTRKDKFLSFRFSFNKGISAEALKIGFPIVILSLLQTMQRTGDSMVVVSRYGDEFLGYYSLGVAINFFVYHAPTAISVVMFPRFQERFGRNPNIQNLKEYVLKPNMALGYFAMPLIIGGAFFFVPALVHIIIPDFAPGIAPLKVLLSGTFWLSMVLMPFNLLITADRRIHAALFGILGAAFSFGGAMIAAHFDWGLTGVAGMVAIGYFLFYQVLSTFVIVVCRWEIDVFKYQLKLFAVFAWTAFCAYMCDTFINMGDGITASLLSSALKYAVFVALISPVLYYGEKQTGIIAKIVKYISNSSDKI